jgi:hypothetical protein
VKNQYVADVNDYLKYALLRTLVDADERTAVVWMLTADDTRTDGQRLRYLNQAARFRAIDSVVFDRLQDVIRANERTIAAVERQGLIPNALYIRGQLDDSKSQRAAYFSRAWRAARGSHLVFLDPDNGIEVRSVPKGRRNSAKYVYWDELTTAYHSGHSLLVYQHFPRRPRLAFVDALVHGVEERMGCSKVLALMTPNVAFLLFAQPTVTHSFARKLKAFAARTSPFKTAFAEF